MKPSFIFFGGSRDGQKVVSGPGVKRYQFLTSNGKLGARFRELPDESSKRMKDLIIPPEMRETHQRAIAEAMKDPRLLAMLKIVSDKPQIADSALEKTFELAFLDACKKHGLDKTYAQTDFAQLQEEFHELSIHEIYEVTKGLEEDASVMEIHLTCVGDDNTTRITLKGDTD